MSEPKRDNYISDADADRLIAAHDGDMALLYIYRLRTGCTDEERTAAELCMTLRSVREAEEKLRRFSGVPAAVQSSASGNVISAEPSEEIPEYKTEDIMRRAETDSGFAAIITEAANVMGKPLSSPDIKMLFGVYDHLGMPAEVMMMMINYCGMVYEKKYSGQRRPSARIMQKEAVYWANREIMSIEAAEEYIDWQNRRTSDVGRIKELLGIRGRELVKAEADRINSWLDMGFNEETISIAFERTVTNIGSLKWNYMDKIIQSWKEKKLFTPQEIEEKDGRSRISTRGKTATSQQTLDFSALDKVLGKI